MDKIPMTAGGFQALTEELRQRQQVERQRIIQAIAEARAPGDSEADVKGGKVSISSPIARALIGKKTGDSIEVNTPGGGKSYEILEVAYR